MANNANDTAVRPYRVLFVCTGNTCRSPMAEGILKKAVHALPTGSRPIDVQSAGTSGLYGMPATDAAISVAQQYGVDISGHESQALTRELLDEADLVLTLAAEHYETCQNLGVDEDRLFMLRSYPKKPRDLRRDSIADPMGGSRPQYERAFFEIDEAIHRALPFILANAGITGPKR
jgi:protein-tyrosine-phosphatase